MYFNRLPLVVKWLLISGLDCGGWVGVCSNWQGQQWNVATARDEWGWPVKPSLYDGGRVIPRGLRSSAAQYAGYNWS